MKGRKKNSAKPPAPGPEELDIRKILAELGRTDVCEFEYEKGDTRIVIKKEPLGRIIGDDAEPAGEADIHRGAAPKPEKPVSKKIIKSPAVGTFYFIENERPLVKAGDAVGKGKKLGWVNSMGIHQDIVVKKNAVVKSVLCADASSVEWGQELFEIEETD